MSTRLFSIYEPVLCTVCVSEEEEDLVVDGLDCEPIRLPKDGDALSCLEELIPQLVREYC